MALIVNRSFFGVEISVDGPNGRPVPILDRDGRPFDFSAEIQSINGMQNVTKFYERVEVGGRKIIHP